jgi:Cd2+/Zn2+-exporting ATPase
VYVGTFNEIGALEIQATKVGTETTLGVMVLATPTALVASIGNAALRGSLVKKGATIEALAKVNAIAFDKTGTLTDGQPKLTTVLPLNGMGEQELLRLAASAEKFSEHPLGRALVQAASERGLPLSDPQEFTMLAGLGVRVKVDGALVIIGRLRLLREQGIALDQEIEIIAGNLAAAGRTVVVAALDGQVIGMFVLEDMLRPEAKEVVVRLKKLRVRTVLVTGDNAMTGLPWRPLMLGLRWA